MDWLAKISLLCIAGSYGLALLLELSRLVTRVPLRNGLIIAASAMGLFAHAVHLGIRARNSGIEGFGWLATWYDWSLLAALGLAIAYIAVTIRRPEATVGYFLLPPLLGLLLLARWVLDLPPFSRDEAVNAWRALHAAGMAAGVSAILLGLSAGLMYLVQSWRLKRKKVGTTALRLPPLDWIQALNRGCLITGMVALTIGLISGVIMNLNRSGQVVWTEPGIVLSGVLVLWLLAATLFEFFYRPARRGRKFAYLMVANAGFLLLALYGVVGGSHVETRPSNAPAIPLHNTTANPSTNPSTNATTNPPANAEPSP
jgi:ABC-type uncharacterized transport system permease subunit